MHHRNIAYLIADSAHARIVMWDRDIGDYRTVVEIHDGQGLPPLQRRSATALEHLSHRWHGADPKALRQRIRGAFAVVLAEHIRQFARERPVDGFVLAAPVRVLGPLKAALKGGPPPILGTLAKDLTKRGSHDLRPWLVRAEEQVPA